VGGVGDEVVKVGAGMGLAVPGLQQASVLAGRATWPSGCVGAGVILPVLFVALRLREAGKVSYLHGREGSQPALAGNFAAARTRRTC
jgi:hypothetical protein